jgi:ribulose-phosphate 3-epimerase
MSMETTRAALWARLREESLVAPSLLSADFASLASEIKSMEDAGAKVLHLDVMDGHFVPNITFGPPVVASIRRTTDLWLDAHLMVRDPLAFLEPFARAGADSLSIHVETGAETARCRAEADRLGVRLGIAIRPDSPLPQVLSEHGEHCDLVLVMSVVPGFGGQSFLEGSVQRLEEAAAYCQRSPRRPVLEVDGGINAATAVDAVRAGVRWLVAGNAIFRQSDPPGAFRRLDRVLRAGSGPLKSP